MAVATNYQRSFELISTSTDVSLYFRRDLLLQPLTRAPRRTDGIALALPQRHSDYA